MLCVKYWGYWLLPSVSIKLEIDNCYTVKQSLFPKRLKPENYDSFPKGYNEFFTDLSWLLTCTNILLHCHSKLNCTAHLIITPALWGRVHCTQDPECQLVMHQFTLNLYNGRPIFAQLFRWGNSDTEIVEQLIPSLKLLYETNRYHSKMLPKWNRKA